MEQPEQELDPDYTCFVCYEVLLDPVTLACGHTLDQRCLLRVVAAASSGAGQRACPMCRHELPEVLPSINVQLRNAVQQRHPEQVNPQSLRGGTVHGAWACVADAVHAETQVEERRAEEAPLEVARATLETALSTKDVEALRSSARAAWRSEQEPERLRAMAVRVCQETPALAQRMERVRATQNTVELRGVGLVAVRTAGRDTLCAMAVQAAAQQGVDVNTRTEGAALGARASAPWRWLRDLPPIYILPASIILISILGYTGFLTTLAIIAFLSYIGFLASIAFLASVVSVSVIAVIAYIVVRYIVGGTKERWLVVAAKDGLVETLRALVEAGAEVNHADHHGSTALYAAAHNGRWRPYGRCWWQGRRWTTQTTLGALLSLQQRAKATWRLCGCSWRRALTPTTLPTTVVRPWHPREPITTRRRRWPSCKPAP